MKKVLICITALLILVVCLVGCTPSITKHENPDYVALDSDSYALLEEFVTQFPNRTPSMENKKSEGGVTPVAGAPESNLTIDAAKWIAAKLNEADPSVGAALKEFSYKNPRFDDRIDKDNNVIATKKSSSANAKTVVIGANYDNAARFVTTDNKVVGGEGVYANAGGVIALIQTARALRDVNLPFNVVYAAFGSSEIGFAGSDAFIRDLANKDDVLLMINYNKVVGGEYMYMYSNEVDTIHNEYFYDAANNASINIAKTPKYINNKTNQYFEGTHLAYYKEPMYGDHLQFMVDKFMVLSYTSANFSDLSTNQVKEFAGASNIQNTQADTLSTVVERYGGETKGIAKINDMINTAVSTTSHALRGESFVAVMLDSKEKIFDYSVFGDGKIMQYIGIGILVAVVLAALIVYFVLKTKAKAHPVYRMTPYGVVDITTGNVVSGGGSTVQVDPFGDDAEVGGDSDPFGHDDTVSKQSARGNTRPSSNNGAPKQIKDVEKKDVFDDF